MQDQKKTPCLYENDEGLKNIAVHDVNMTITFGK